MTPTILAFAVLAVASAASAIGVIAFKNAVYSALSLILTLFFLAMFYLQLGAMFIAVVQVLIYAGAIMVLFLFVVTMLTSDAQDKGEDRIPWQRYVGSLLGVVLVGALSYLIFKNVSGSPTVLKAGESYSHAVATHGNVEAFGLALFHGYLFPFEVTSLLIVVAILGALVFGRRA
ncbi:NADH-quinone oxidoreductase subunit J [Ktedonobacter racemifer]|uniref:NADH-quinone oxidoreductase subunit J n=1 Tax=Ktedonobacter racemifer DSM 44963 TaxID=485913 RepID=D6TQN9_KTERA|nr:NADH-quinone oxidoreductase subunit J [Ktedonobacter racemifer]EFH87706.1 NADH-ubiquinone/plastoquinone oxidoreductase chain 6 [Ktedonobacter racemifer DSM 44963]